MQQVFLLLQELRREVLGEVRSPPAERQNAFGYGRVHGQLFMLDVLEERLSDMAETAAAEAEDWERKF